MGGCFLVRSGISGRRCEGIVLLFFFFLFFLASAVVVANLLDMVVLSIVVECLTLTALSGECSWGVGSGVGGRSILFGYCMPWFAFEGWASCVASISGAVLSACLARTVGWEGGLVCPSGDGGSLAYTVGWGRWRACIVGWGGGVLACTVGWGGGLLWCLFLCVLWRRFRGGMARRVFVSR